MVLVNLFGKFLIWELGHLGGIAENFVPLGFDWIDWSKIEKVKKKIIIA